MPALPPPSPWITRWGALLPAGASVLDVACGSGRHLRWFYERNHPVTGVDQAQAAIKSIAQWAEAIEADLEAGPWPLAGRQFDCVLVTNYLWRPLLPTLIASLAPGGLLLYETFAQGNEAFGRPARPEFLLRPGELLQACAGLRVHGYEEGFLAAPARCVQRIAARRETTAPEGTAPAPACYRL